MRRSSYRDQDYAFGQAMLTLRAAMGLTQTGLADALGVSRRAIGAWEAGSKYPNAEHLKQFIALAVKQRVFTAGQEADEIRALWRAARQKVLLDEAWLSTLISPVPLPRAPFPRTTPAASRQPDMPRAAVAVKLPFQPTPFIGREAELGEIARLLDDPSCRLLTLLGLGGVGKTRLVLEAAARHANQFRDGVVFVSLAAVGAPNQIVSAIGETLNLSFAGQDDSAAHLLNYLRGRHLLLVLDNFEHLVDGADLVYDILQYAANITILVTSRARLNLQAEWLFDVEGLTYPSSSPETVTGYAEYSALQLFVQRVTQIQPSFALSDTSLPSIVRICQHIAGMPLAIELAAAGVRTHSLDEIEQQINVSLTALSTSLRDVPPRHRSLRAVFDHSWRLLTEAERDLFSRLAVFRGGCSAEAAAQVAGARLQGLMTLVDKSLLRQVHESTHNEPRFLLLEPAREYALEKLSERGEAQALHYAHAVYYLALAETAAARWDTLDAETAIAQLDRDYDNIRAVLRWARDGGDLTLGLRLGGALRKFWQRRGYFSEGRAWIEDLLEQEYGADYSGAGGDAEALIARSEAMYSAAWLASDQHDYARATQLFEQGLALRRSLGDAEDNFQLLVTATRQARTSGQYQRAAALLEDALARDRALGNWGTLTTGGVGLWLYQLGMVMRERGEFARSAALFEECVEVLGGVGDREGLAAGLLGLSDVARDTGDAARARLYTEQSLDHFRDLNIQWAIGFALHNLAQAAYLDGDVARAMALVSESEALFRRLHADGSIAEILTTRGRLLLAQGEVDAAHTALSEALRLAWIHGPRLLVAAALEGLAGALTQSGEAFLAVQFIAAASVLRAEMGAPVRPVDQAALDAALSAAQASIGIDAFSAAWSEAKRLPLEAVLSAVLDIPAQDTAPQPVEDSPVAPSASQPAGPSAVRQPHVDWDDALRVPKFYGREWELDLVRDWVIKESCHVVTLIGLGGIGKSTLAVNLMHQVAADFEVVIWRSLRDIPTCEVLLDDLLQVLAPQTFKGDAAASFDRRMNILLEQLRTTRILIVLDNLESVLGEGESAGRIRPGYEGFGRFLRQSAETKHQSCVLLTSREKPGELIPLEGSHAPVRALRLARLDTSACVQLLAERGIVGSAAEQVHLVDAYGGNPLALKIAAQTIIELFAGQLAPFLQQGEVIFGGVREMLAEQFNRLSKLDQSVLFWLAIMRQPCTINELSSVIVASVPRARLLETLEGLHRRSLIERGHKQGGFTLQSIVMEYATARLIADVSDEIQRGQLSRLTEYGLELAQCSEYIRGIQELLLLKPVLAQLRGTYTRTALLEQQFQTLLRQLATLADYEQGYGPANLIALLRLLRGHLRGLDLSGLALRGVVLQGVDLQDSDLSGAMIQDSVFNEAFDLITAVAVSDSYWAAASGGEIRLWDTGGHTLRYFWRAHTDMIWALAFSPDGQRLATGSWDGTVKLWDSANGSLLWTGRHMSHVNMVAFAPDGLTLASSSSDTSVRLWSVQDGAALFSLAHPAPVPTVAYSPDGHTMATGDLEGSVRLWTLQADGPPAMTRMFTGHSIWVDCVAFSPDGSLLASASWDKTVRIWDIDSGRWQTLDAHTDRVSRVAWSADGKTLATGSRDSTIRLWNVEQRSYRVVLDGHSAGVNGIAFTADDLRLLSGSLDGTLRVWDTANGDCNRVIRGFASALYDIDWSPDGTRIASGGTDHLVSVYDVSQQTPPIVLRGHGGVVLGISWSSGKWLASSEWDNVIRLWDADAGETVRVLRHPEDAGNYFYGIAWSPDGQRLASATYRRGAHVFEMNHLQRHQRAARPFPTWVRHVTWHPDGTLVAGGGDDGKIYIWDAANGTLILELAGHHSMITCMAWSPDGTQIASGGGVESGELFVWDLQRDEPDYRIIAHPGIVHSLAWDSNGTLLMSGGGDGALRWWDVRSGEQRLMREAHTGTLRSLKRSPDGTMLASCGDDGAVMMWDLATGEYVQTLRRDRPYERLNISGITGLTSAQKATLRALGAVEPGQTL